MSEDKYEIVTRLVKYAFVAVIFSGLSYTTYTSAYELGQIDQASGVATVTLTTQPNGESRWEPTTKASK